MEGQTERMNKVLRESLKTYVLPHHRDWDQHLIPTEIAYNDSVHGSIRETLNYLNMGRHPLLAHDFIRCLRVISVDNIDFSQNRTHIDSVNEC